MKIYFDTEFTGLHQQTTLISIGLISEDDKTFYAELTHYDYNQLDDWIKKNVIENLTNPETNLCGNDWTIKGSKTKVSNALKVWFDQFDSIELVSDVSHYDMVLLIDLFGTAFDLPKQVAPVCHDINQDIAKYLNISEKEAFDVSREKFANIEEGAKHNSLWDAKVIKRCYEKIEEENK